MNANATYTLLLLNDISAAMQAVRDVAEEMRRDADRIEAALRQGTAPMSLSDHHGPAAARDALVAAVTLAKKMGVAPEDIAAVLDGVRPFDVVRLAK